ncbi:hypothetical protein F444_07709, partial [Phytophthora nicotianae P1976]
YSVRFNDTSLPASNSLSMAGTALKLWQARASTSIVLPSGCDSIDELLHGGFRSGILTEICGEASAGKTQLCLQLLLQCCLPRSLGGLQGTACYICTEGVGSVKRLHDLAQVYAKRYSGVMGVGAKRKRGEQSSNLTSSDFLDGIFVEQLYTVDDLMDLVVCITIAVLISRVFYADAVVVRCCSKRDFRRCWPSRTPSWWCWTRLQLSFV